MIKEVTMLEAGMKAPDFTLSDKDGKAYGGHLVEGTKVLLTVDVVVAEIEGLVMGRKFDSELEVPLFAPRQA